MITKKSPKIAKKFYCKSCHYTSRNKYDFNKHLSTTKHKKITQMVTFVAKNRQLKCECGKTYKFSSGLSRHRKKCTFQKQNIVGDHNSEHNEKVSEKTETGRHKSQNMPESASLPNSANNSVSELCKIMQNLVEDNCRKTELMEKLLNQNSELIPKVGSNNNNSISINVFLNEHCKSAMNLGDFVENVKVTIDDLLYTKDNGYVKGISNIFVKHLTDMKPTERPIVCSDKKRLQFYVKEEDTWQKDKEHTKLNKSIQNVSIKQIKKLKEWEALHPNYLVDEELIGEWHQMVQKIMGGASNAERVKNTEDIKKGILDTVDMKKALV